MSGIMASEGRIHNGVPQQVQSTAIADYATGIAIAWGVCAALYHRERTGRGQKIEATLLATALGLQTDRFLRIAAIDDEPRDRLREENQHAPGRRRRIRPDQRPLPGGERAVEPPGLLQDLLGERRGAGRGMSERPPEAETPRRAWPEGPQRAAARIRAE